jgi:hypothetical protein
MANRTFLFCVDHAGDAEAPADYDADKATVAERARGVPLLWLALFRPGDLRRWPNGDDGFAEGAEAEKERALLQLDAALPVLNALFAKQGPLDEYVSVLKQALLDRPGRIVAWDFTERTWLDSGDSFRMKIEYLLAFLDDPKTTVPVLPRGFLDKLFARPLTEPHSAALAWFTEVCALDLQQPFGPLKPAQERTERDWNVVVDLLGGSWIERVPWEEEAAK